MRISLTTVHFHQCFVDKDYPVGVSLMRQQELAVGDFQFCTQSFSAPCDVDGVIPTIVGEIETGIGRIGFNGRGQSGARCGKSAQFGGKCVVEKFHVRESVRTC